MKTSSSAVPTEESLESVQMPADQMPAAGGGSAVWLPVWTLTARELIRFFRQRTRIVGALGQPVLFWILFGTGLSGSFQPPGWAPANMSYQEFFFPGIAVLILLFTAIFSTISIIEDRREGFLQGVLVAPIPRFSLVLGKLCGGTVLAVVQAVMFLLIGPVLVMIGLSPAIHIGLSVLSVVETLAFLVLLGFFLTALGYCIAWPLDSTQGFHAIMSVFLFPMWLLSGAFFPGEGAGWLSWVIAVNPLTYGVAGLRQVMYADPNFGPGLPSLSLCLAVTVGFTLLCLGVAIWLTQRQTSQDTR